MQTILGSNGQIGTELAKELYRNFTKDLRLVNRNPKQINGTDELVSADLMKLEDAERAIEGSEIVYFTVGLPMDTKILNERFPIITSNVIAACEKFGSKLVFFDNTYMYAKNDQVQTEESPFEPVGEKSVMRAGLAEQVLKEMNAGRLDAVIYRAPEFYGPDQTQSLTNSFVIDNVKAGKRAIVPLRDDVLRSLIYTPDASKAMALIANSPETFNQTWHLPIAETITYANFIKIIEQEIGKPINYKIMKEWEFKAAALTNKMAKETLELLPRYEVDNIFSSEKFKTRFPEFKVTSFEEGLKYIFNQI